MTYTIALMTYDDVPQVAAIERQCFPDPWSERMLREHLDNQCAAALVARGEDGTILGYGGLLVAADEGDTVQGYAFCVFQQRLHDNLMTDIKTLYIDDLCVDAAQRGRGVGRALFEFVKAFARRSGCYNLTLNVWACNASAMRFYERCGLAPQKVGLEAIL